MKGEILKISNTRISLLRIQTNFVAVGSSLECCWTVKTLCYIFVNFSCETIIMYCTITIWACYIGDNEPVWSCIIHYFKTSLCITHQYVTEIHWTSFITCLLLFICALSESFFILLSSDISLSLKFKGCFRNLITQKACEPLPRRWIDHVWAANIDRLIDKMLILVRLVVFV